ncbi:sensor histidine kinase [Halorubrum sp. JWXQ-INN 858]|uniref:sensor histidine kinase n=1 Tax=Halorubrum sp. JWXQ-INN 858 TaxID=2690782 RepID=UPI001356BFC5|nr:HAMP domain-containing sensor histidine kinase [Halorubrum sp. JWXQ-INN 858]MWV63747.1 sensor histidine kinase [Halorubrum sp. JWXQ-INN 858]
MKDIGRELLGRSPFTVAVVYFGFGIVWVPAIDRLLATTVATAEPTGAAGLAGGWLLVALSALVVYGVAAHHYGRADDARRELETSNQQLQVLSRVFRHNVRNDLNVVQGYTNLLEDRVDDERSRRYLETIQETTDDVVAISEKLRVVEDVSPTDRTRVNLVDVVHEAVDDVRAAGVDITVETPSEAWIHADRSVGYPVREVFENAIAHNDKRVCRLDARIDADSSAVCLRVRDNGPGIPESEQAVLRAEEETPLSHASSIGLWLVKWMCELHGGTVRFDVTDDGTTVQLRFRATKPGDAGTVGTADGGRTDGGRTDGGRTEGKKTDGGRMDGKKTDGGRADGRA